MRARAWSLGFLVAVAALPFSAQGAAPALRLQVGVGMEVGGFVGGKVPDFSAGIFRMPLEAELGLLLDDRLELFVESFIAAGVPFALSPSEAEGPVGLWGFGAGAATTARDWRFAVGAAAVGGSFSGSGGLERAPLGPGLRLEVGPTWQFSDGIETGLAMRVMYAWLAPTGVTRTLLSYGVGWTVGFH